ncbi:MAG: PAS domain S-box protein [Patescibacteria group bacterium]
MQTQKIVEQLGYTPNEAKVYLTALGLGECHVSDIALKLKLPRSSVQVIVNTLHKNGLMNFYVKNRYKYWVAERPERLLEQLKQREEMVSTAMPALTALRKSDKMPGRPHVKIFEGIDEIKLIHEDMLETRQHMLGIIPWDEWINLLGRGFMEDFIERRMSRYLRMRLLIPKTVVAEELKSRDGKELRETRYMPRDVPISATVLIYGNKVAVVSLNKKMPTAVLIEDPGVSDTKKAFFEELWSRSNGEDRSRDEQLFRLLAERSPQPLLITNEKIEIEYVNPSWEELFGYSLEEVRGKNPEIFRSDKTSREVYERMWKTLYAGKHFQSNEIIDKKKNGDLFNLSTTIFPVTSGGRLFYVQVLDDITRRKKVEALHKRLLQAAAKNVPAPLANAIKKFLDESSFG